MRYNLLCSIRRCFALSFLTATAMGTLPVTAVYAASVECPPNNDEYVSLPNPDDCGSFYKCDDGVPFYYDCPAGLHFSPELQVCDWPESAKCTAGAEEKEDE